MLVVACTIQAQVFEGKPQLCRRNSPIFSSLPSPSHGHVSGEEQNYQGARWQSESSTSSREEDHILGAGDRKSHSQKELLLLTESSKPGLEAQGGHKRDPVSHSTSTEQESPQEGSLSQPQDAQEPARLSPSSSGTPPRRPHFTCDFSRSVSK